MGLVNSLAVVMSAFATTDVFMFFTSLAAGSTVGSQIMITYSIISHYFTKRRDIANTIMVLGSSANLLVIPYFFTYLHDEYGFRGAILITGGACLNQIPASMVFHPVEWHSRNHVHRASIQESEDSKSDHLPVVFILSYIPFVMQTTGYTLEDAAYCLTMLGVFHFLTRLIHPCLSSTCGGSNFPIMATAYGAIPIALPQASTEME
ncbi:monocarboxylate transporter 4-like [Scylla paramamosain]|uniref:monocarboxylate transporter 4-like n=1 Tax=Scylla paramamosain TaxID=85552 RepID=UPI003082ACB3